MIKYRVWDKSLRKMYTNENHFGAGDTEEYYGGEVSICFSVLKNLQSNKQYVFQQWTGLQDKNGLDIYEGDVIVDWKECLVLTVKKNDSPVQFMGENYYIDSTMVEPDIFNFALHNDSGRYEVFGTIFGLKQKPCKPDHNGECLICDCWLSECHLHEHLRMENK